MEASVRDMKNHLSEYLRRVAEGEEVTITSRGQPVARLTPFPQSEEDRHHAIRKRLAAVPWIRPAKEGKPLGAATPIRIESGETSLSDIVIKDRR